MQRALVIQLKESYVEIKDEHVSQMRAAAAHDQVFGEQKMTGETSNVVLANKSEYYTGKISNVRKLMKANIARYASSNIFSLVSY